MARPIDPDLQARNLDIRRKYEYDGVTVAELASQYNFRQTSNVSRILKGCDRAKHEAARKRREAELKDMRPISPKHLRIGNNVAVVRTKVLRLDRSDFSKLVGMPPQMVRRIETGVEEVTVSQISRLAGVLNVIDYDLIFRLLM